MLVAIGTILKPRGLQGELKTEITYNRPAVFNDLKSVDLGGKTYTVARGSVQNGFVPLGAFSRGKEINGKAYTGGKTAGALFGAGISGKQARGIFQK